jgi:hypothetical protein
MALMYIKFSCIEIIALTRTVCRVELLETSSFRPDC